MSEDRQMKKNLFNEDAMSLDTYIMVKLKEKTAQLRDKLTQKVELRFLCQWVRQLQILHKF